MASNKIHSDGHEKPDQNSGEASTSASRSSSINSAANADKNEHPDDNVMASVLEEVLKATDASADFSDASSGANELQIFQEVARRLQGESIALEDATVELVKAVYAQHYPHVVKKLGGTKALAAEISSVMMESPSTRARVQSFWDRLVESVS